MESASLFALGMRRLAADLGLIRLLIYYGTIEADEAPEGHAHEHSWEAGEYPELGPRVKRILDMDPSFGYAAAGPARALPGPSEIPP